MIRPHARVRHPSMHLQPRQTEDGNDDPPRTIPHRTVWNPQPHWLITDWLGHMRQRHSVVIGTHPRIIHASVHLQTSMNRGRKQQPFETRPPRTGWKTQCHWLTADWVGAREPSDRQGAYGPMPGSYILLYIYHSSDSGTKTVISPDDTTPPPTRCGNPKPRVHH